MRWVRIAMLAAAAGLIRSLCPDTWLGLTVVNVFGSVLLAAVRLWPQRVGKWGEAIVVGFCGSLTTFSGVIEKSVLDWPAGAWSMLLSMACTFGCVGFIHAMCGRARRRQSASHRYRANRMSMSNAPDMAAMDASRDNGR